jgi:hypothetical protein
VAINRQLSGACEVGCEFDLLTRTLFVPTKKLGSTGPEKPAQIAMPVPLQLVIDD